MVTLLLMFLALGLSAFGKLAWPITIPILLPGIAVSMWMTQWLFRSTQMPGLSAVGYTGLMIGFLLNWVFLIGFLKIRARSVNSK